MSFLARIAPAARTASLSLRPTTTPVLSVGATRSISATARRDKGPIDATKETLKKADRKVSDAAVKGIEVGGMYTNRVYRLEFPLIMMCRKRRREGQGHR